MVKTRMVRVEYEIWKTYKKASADYDFGVGALINWVLSMKGENVEVWAKNLDSSVEFDKDEVDKMSKEAESEDKEEVILKSKDEDESESEDEDEDEDDSEDEDEEEVD